MKRIITYLHEYQNGMRRGSAGVFKMDLLGEECRIQLNLQGSVPVEEQGTVYFVVRHGEGNLIGVPVGEASRYRGSGGGNWVVRQNGICGSRYSFDDVHGMAVRYPSGRYLASCWEENADERFLRGDFGEEKEQTENADEKFLRGDFIEQKSTGKMEGIRKSEAALNFRSAANPEVVENLENIGNLGVIENLEVVEDNPEAVRDEKPDGNSQISKKTGKITMEDGDRESAENQGENAKVQGKEENPLKTGRDNGELHAEELPGTASKETMQRMDISDIRSLPKKNWHLCSNSFLIHAFFSYHYLVRKDVEEDGVIKSYLGVPGIYARPERAMAMLFGFPEFEEAHRSANSKKNTITKEQAGEAKGANSKEPRIPEGTFGYWLCQLEM